MRFIRYTLLRSFTHVLQWLRFRAIIPLQNIALVSDVSGNKKKLDYFILKQF